ncbi:MAG: hypothetical protein DHS20C05_25630 [Hyphococcus sp.]|nr:MAG: hypothetical protein DHS20C05_25630 [Marinicaulis sp.]
MKFLIYLGSLFHKNFIKIISKPNAQQARNSIIINNGERSDVIE